MSEFSKIRRKFAFIASALEASGGFAPDVSVSTDADGVTRYALTGPCELVRHPREPAHRYAARAALAVYENHLSAAVGRFVGFLMRRQPERAGADSPMPALLAGDADMQGNSLDDFWRHFAVDAVARGSMLLVFDLPSSRPQTAGEQLRTRAVPYIRAAKPETVADYSIDSETGLFSFVALESVEEVDGEKRMVRREYTRDGWSIKVRDADGTGKLGDWRVHDEDTHTLGQCQVLAFTEDGRPFPVLGRYAQVADLSRSIYNVRSEIREIHRARGFPLLSLQVPGDSDPVDAAKLQTTISVHGMMTYTGERPGYLSPDNGPVESLMAEEAGLKDAIARITDDAAVTSAGQAESGVARRMRFDALNAKIALFAGQLRRLESRVWELYAKATGSPARVSVTWPADYNLADTAVELDTLSLMQDAGFPEPVLNLMRRRIAATEFDNADDDTKVLLSAAFDEAERSRPAAVPAAPGSAADPRTPPEPDLDDEGDHA